MHWARSGPIYSNTISFPDTSIHVPVKILVKLFVDSGRAVDAFEFTLLFYYIYAKETREIRHRVKSLFEKSTSKIQSRQKFILQLIYNVRTKKVSLENVEAIPSSINFRQLFLESLENVMEKSVCA